MKFVKTQNLSYTYPDGKKISFADLYCPKGEKLLITGKSGSGKTTLLHLLAGILSSDGGTIEYDGHDITAFNPARMDQFRGRNIGMVFQQHIFIEGISILDNLKAARRLAENLDDIDYLRTLLRKFDISRLSVQKPHQLSEGEKQRLSIVRALANKPSWILADEPTSSLDDENCNHFIDMMNLTESEFAVSWIIATHDQRLKNYFKNVYDL